MSTRVTSRAYWIAGGYALFAGLWIYFSDAALAALVADRAAIVEWSTFKGVAFVLVTSALLLLVMQQAFGEVGREREFAAAIVDSLPGILYLYDERGRFLRWNANFVEVSGYSPAEIASMHPLQFFGQEDRALLAERIGEVFSAGKATAEAPFVTKDGRRLPYYFTGRRIIFEGTTCLVGMGIDISERIRTEEARAKAEEALREANQNLEMKIAERTRELQAALLRAESADRLKSAFLATMSHELRTPLNSILGFTGIMLKGLPGPLNEEQTRQLGMVQGSARHLLALISDVLDISKIEAGQLEVRCEPFDLARSLERAVNTVTPMAERQGLALSVNAPGTLAMTSDARRVEQILLNLLNNAIKFTPKGSVNVTVTSLEQHRAAPDGAPCQAVSIAVADTGIGIREEDQAKLFQPFYQIDSGLARRHDGTGLGLAICRRLAALLGGCITAESIPGAGSTFTVTLPLDAREQAAR